MKALVEKKRVKDPSEIAFLFPSLGSASVEKMQRALEAQGLAVYAPRAKSFIEVPEALGVFGMLLLIFGYEPHHYPTYRAWQERAAAAAKNLIRADTRLALFVKDKQAEITAVVRSDQALVAALKAVGRDVRAQRDSPAFARVVPAARRRSSARD